MIYNAYIMHSRTMDIQQQIGLQMRKNNSGAHEDDILETDFAEDAADVD